MAIINGQAPPPDPRLAGAPRRVVVKLSAEAPREAAASAARLAEPLGGAWAGLLDRYPALAMRPYFEDAWAEPSATVSRNGAEAEDVRYLVVDVAGGVAGTDTTIYTPTFGGTSGASPIVAGAALLLQSLRVRQGLPLYPPARMRQLLAAATNTTSANPAVDRIGVMPDLRAIVTRERLAPAPPNGLRVIR